MATATSRSVNYWPDSKCAKAFWSQQELIPYRELLQDTCAWLDPQPGERWLDLGAGSCQLTRVLWQRSKGTLAEVVALDCAPRNARTVDKLRQSLQPAPGDRLRFALADFSTGLGLWGSRYFDGVVSGLALQYAESYSVTKARWTTDAYDRLLGEVQRVLRPGGRFVFSVNVPHPSWLRVALSSLPGILLSPHRLQFIKNCVRMLRYGRWLKQEAQRGRFHYLPIESVTSRLAAAGFTWVEHRLSFARQAYVIRCRKT